MSFLKRFFHPTEKVSSTQPVEQAVLIHLDGTNLSEEIYEQNDLSTIEDRLIAALAGKGVGEFDGNETGPSGTTLYLYGPDAERLFSLIEPVLLGYPLCRNARAVIRKGGPGAPQREVHLPTA